MIKHLPLLILALLLLPAAPAAGQANRGEPEIGYLYPAGARRGTVVRVLVGGQNLRGCKGVRVSGEGVSGTVVRYMGRFVNLNGEERRALRRQIEALKKDRAAPKPAAEEDEPAPLDGPRPEPLYGEEKGGDDEAAPGAKKEPDPDLVKLTRHPLLSILPQLTDEELEFVERKFLRTDPRAQLNAQIGETAMVEVTVDADAPPGDRELRLFTQRGLTNPACFQVGTLPETREPAPADPRGGDTEILALPAVLNGQITPGDVDRFRVRAEKGQNLVIRAFARRLVPFLADAVPGWFQAVLAVRDAEGRELAFGDDFRFDPDPVLCFAVPETGVYKVEIRDSIYRGRDDFVYRIAISEQPFITSLFPLGGRSGEPALASVAGWNLEPQQLLLDTWPGPRAVRHTALEAGGAWSNFVAYAVDALPEVLEAEPGDRTDTAQDLALPVIVNGRIATPGDTDRFRFEGKAGDRIVAEVTARALGSPLDAVLRLTDASGRVLAWNDDCVDKEGHLHRGMGVLTHFADPYLLAALPEDGVYGIEITDARGQGSPAHGYRLRLGPPRPDFALRVTPSAVNLMGSAAVFTVHVLRRDGFDGPIEVKLLDAPPGFALQGAAIPPGRDSIRMTLTARGRRPGEPVRLRLEGSARIGEEELRREALPADDEMQAFLWRHLVPAEEWVAAVVGPGVRGTVEHVGDEPVQIPRGGSVLVRVKAPNLPKLPGTDEIQLELAAPPPGIAISDVKIFPGMVWFTLRAGDDAPAAGFADNLIVQAFLQRTPVGGKGRAARARRVPVGMLPALPIRVVEP